MALSFVPLGEKLMRLAHRKAHRYIWSLLLPLLFLVVLLLSHSSLDTLPANVSVPGLPGDSAESSTDTDLITKGLAHRELP